MMYDEASNSERIRGSTIVTKLQVFLETIESSLDTFVTWDVSGKRPEQFKKIRKSCKWNAEFK